jgi:hypothetical protein
VTFRKVAARRHIGAAEELIVEAAAVQAVAAGQPEDRVVAAVSVRSSLVSPPDCVTDAGHVIPA